jgi:hypothetical protein
MESVNVIFKDGTQREFNKVGRPGGSYSIHVKYEGNFVIVEDEWGHQTAFPAADVKEVKTRQNTSIW